MALHQTLKQYKNVTQCITSGMVSLHLYFIVSQHFLNCRWFFMSQFCWRQKVKIKLSPCLTKHHAMKTLKEWRWVVSFTPRPLYHRGCGPPEPIGFEAGWGLRAGLNAMAKRKNPIIAPARNRTLVLKPAA